MSNIKNNPTILEDQIQSIRGAMHHRAVWLYLLIDEAKKAGIPWEEFARKAMSRCGCFHGEGIATDCRDLNDLREFNKVFADEMFTKLFEMEVIDVNEDLLQLHFHHCPLVAGWQSIGCSDAEIAQLCDIAMDGDRGIASSCNYTLTLGETLAQGGSVCDIRFTKK